MQRTRRIANSLATEGERRRRTHVARGSTPLQEASLLSEGAAWLAHVAHSLARPSFPFRQAGGSVGISTLPDISHHHVLAPCPASVVLKRT